MKRKIIVMLLSVLAVIVIGVAVIFALLQNEGQSYTSMLSQADRYINAGDYDGAVLVLQKAIAADPESPEGYISLARVYQQMGSTDLAINTLVEGYQITGNLTINRLLLELDPEAQIGQSGGDDENSIEGQATEKEESKPALNTEFLNFASAASYEDYRMKYGTVNCSMEGNVCTAKAAGLEASLRFYDTSSARVINTASGQPYKEMIPNEIVMDNIAVLFGASQVTYEELRTMSGITNLKQNGSTVSFTACGCEITITVDENGTIYSRAEHRIVPTGTSNAEGNYSLSGKVIDAATGSYITGATLKFYEGSGAYGDAIEITTDSFGKYSIGLQNSGNHTIVVSKEGYIEENFQVYISSGGNEMTKDFAISSKLEEDQIRLVLTWGALPTDLDSYLVGTTSTGRSINISFMNMIARDSSNVLAQLDVDDMTGYGPETITLNAVDGTYEYYVKDYTGSGTMSSSGAQVKIYKGSSLVEVINVCSGLRNDWSVCRIVRGTITVTNCPR